MILAYSAATDGAGADINPTVEQIFQFVVWVVPIGILILPGRHGRTALRSPTHCGRG